MRPPLEWLVAERIGSEIAEKFGYSDFPIDPRSIAEKRNISVASRPLSGCSGCLIRTQDQFAIIYSDSLVNSGVINFTIGHELGHYFLEGHAEAFFPEGDGIHQSTGAFRSADPREREADLFAVGLLLPEKMFVRALRKAGNGLEAIETLAAQCGTSLTATAIRFATLAEDSVAVIVATGNKVDFCFMSKPLREHRGIEWLRKGSIIPTGTVTAKLAAKPSEVERASKAAGGCSFDDWLDGGPKIDCQEDVVGLGRFGQTLTVIWSDEAIDDAEDDDSYDE